MPAETRSFVSHSEIGTQEKLAVFLAFIAGYIDAVGLIRWKTYVSFMSGNTTQLGIALSTGKPGIITTSIIVISCFLLGIYAGTCLSIWKRFRTQALLIYIVAFIQIIYMAVSYHSAIAPVPSIAIIGFSMGIMNTIVTAVGTQKINTDFITGTLNSLAINTAMFTMTHEHVREQYKMNAIYLTILCIGFLSGAFVAPFFLPLLGNYALIIPAMLLSVCGLIISHQASNHKKQL